MGLYAVCNEAASISTKINGFCNASYKEAKKINVIPSLTASNVQKAFAAFVCTDNVRKYRVLQKELTTFLKLNDISSWLTFALAVFQYTKISSGYNVHSCQTIVSKSDKLFDYTSSVLSAVKAKLFILFLFE